MNTVILTGLSGAGKTRAIDIIEDMGYFCVDNVPFGLVKIFVDLCRRENDEIDNLALVVDIRGDDFTQKSGDAIEALRENVLDAQIFFLDADTETLVGRYQASRRRHPLMERAGSLAKSIELERERLAPLKAIADRVIDTSHFSEKALQGSLTALLMGKEQALPEVVFSSFGFKYGKPIGADYVFDVRFLPNPFYRPELRDLTGNDAEVRDYVMSCETSVAFKNRIVDFLEFVLPEYTKVSKNHVEVAFGCTGGQHRSVTFANLMGEIFKEKGYRVRVAHREVTE